jgi:hypothetical protein
MRTLLFSALLLAAAPAWAEWVKVTESVDTAYYVDLASIVRTGDLRRATVLQDRAGQESDGVRSRRVSYEIDCASERLKSLAATEYSESMAQGSVVKSWESESTWLYVAPRTGSNIPSRTPYLPILRFVCSR